MHALNNESEKQPIIMWLRDDLRIADNPALAKACATQSPVIPLYVVEKSTNAGTAGQSGGCTAVSPPWDGRSHALARP